MFFLSLCPGDSGDAAGILGIDQTFKNVKKYYRLIKIITLPCAVESNEITANIAKTWRDKEYVVHKKIFSQDRRPAKMVRENPRLMVNGAATGERLIQDLRALDIPVEGFFVQKSGPWARQCLGKAIGDNYRISAAELIGTAAAVYAQNRLDLTSCRSHGQCLARRLDQLMTALIQNNPAPGDFADRLKTTDPVLALSIPVWFRETVPYRRPYRA